ncbi:MAG: alkene reductase [Burkholderiales bacterium]|nr:MAG: alkene reductase [Burkholderiales bacterium]
MTPDLLLATTTLAGMELRNRLVMAPMTRSRAPAPHCVPTPLMAEYYRQRAGAGLIISEGAVVSPGARGYAHTPGLYAAEQITGWRAITDAVHGQGGRIFAQLWHCGRVAHRGNHEDGSPVLGASGIAAQTKVYVPDLETGGIKGAAAETPRAMNREELSQVVAAFRQAAQAAREAGFDGVEVHGANGYLFDQFRCPYLNDRQDEYGGTLENRCRLLFETVRGVSEVFGVDRVGLRLSPLGQGNDMKPDPDPQSTYPYLAAECQRLELGFLHLYDQSGSWIHEPGNALLAALRKCYSGKLVVCGGFDAAKAEAALSSGVADLVAFGKPFVSNPDLPRRLALGSALNAWDVHSFYKGGAQGYTDYQALGCHP